MHSRYASWKHCAVLILIKNKEFCITRKIQSIKLKLAGKKYLRSEESDDLLIQVLFLHIRDFDWKKKIPILAESSISMDSSKSLAKPDFCKNRIATAEGLG